MLICNSKNTFFFLHLKASEFKLLCNYQWQNIFKSNCWDFFVCLFVYDYFKKYFYSFFVFLLFCRDFNNVIFWFLWHLNGYVFSNIVLSVFLLKCFKIYYFKYCFISKIKIWYKPITHFMLRKSLKDLLCMLRKEPRFLISLNDGLRGSIFPKSP